MHLHTFPASRTANSFYIGALHHPPLLYAAASHEFLPSLPPFLPSRHCFSGGRLPEGECPSGTSASQPGLPSLAPASQAGGPKYTSTECFIASPAKGPPHAVQAGEALPDLSAIIVWGPVFDLDFTGVSG